MNSVLMEVAEEETDRSRKAGANKKRYESLMGDVSLKYLANNLGSSIHKSHLISVSLNLIF